ncbi:MAG: FkbM family methyltransferase [Candidatus Bathyarchaeia archaeon]
MLERMYDLIRFHLYSMISHYFENQVYTVRCGLLKGLKRKGGLGFIPIMKMTEEEKFLANLKLEGQTVFDVGAFTGLFTMFFARAVGKNGKVIAFEPNPSLCVRIKENLLLNKFDNVKIMQLALGREKKKEVLAFPSMIPGVGSIEEHEKARILKQRSARTIEVDVDTIDNLIAAEKVPTPDFIKIDVQGAELDVLIGASNTIKRCKPKLLIEVHSIPYINWKNKNLQRIVDFLTEKGYSLHHVESGKKINSDTIHTIKADEHLYCF